MTAETFGIEADPGALGSMLESFVHGELQKSLANQQNDFRLYHWRSENQKEIDILAESAKRLVGIARIYLPRIKSIKIPFEIFTKSIFDALWNNMTVRHGNG